MSIYLIKIAVSSKNETDLMNFMALATNDDDRSFSFENLVPISPQLMSLPDLLPSHLKLRHMLNLRLMNWGVIHDCENVKKILSVDQSSFGDQYKYVEYLQFNCKSDVPLNLFKISSREHKNLRFDIVYIENGLTTCGQFAIENGQILIDNVYTNVDTDLHHFVSIGILMSDDLSETEILQSFFV